MYSTQETIRFPVSARVERTAEGSYKMTAAEYADVPLDTVARLFWKIYRAGQKDTRKGESIA